MQVTSRDPWRSFCTLAAAALVAGLVVAQPASGGAFVGDWITADVVPHYLQHSTRGLAAGEVWFNEYGIALSRGFRALRVWLALKAYGADAFGRVMDRNIAQAHALADRVPAVLATPTNAEERSVGWGDLQLGSPPRDPGRD